MLSKNGSYIFVRHIFYVIFLKKYLKLSPFLCLCLDKCPRTLRMKTFSLPVLLLQCVDSQVHWFGSSSSPMLQIKFPKDYKSCRQYLSIPIQPSASRDWIFKNHSHDNLVFLIFFFFFLRERVCTCTHTHVQKRGRGREKILSRIRAQHKALYKTWFHTPKIRTWNQDSDA